MIAFAPATPRPLRIGDLVTIYEKPPSLWHVTGILRGITLHAGELYYQIVERWTGCIEEIKRSEIRRIDRHDPVSQTQGAKP